MTKKKISKAKKANHDLNRAETSVGHNQVIQKSESYSGPLPPAAEMERYNNIHPDLALRIIAMAEHEAKSRQELEKKSLEANIKIAEKQLTERRIGQIFGFLIGVGGLSSAVTFGFLGMQTAAVAVGTTTVIGLVSIFVIGRVIEAGDKPEK